jgi:3-deoxy-D-manno-octulosonate 8-phosphate phosphatase (KDO 8-P phosphatase)
MTELLDKARRVQCLICDVDGVLTDGCIYLDNQGNEQKRFNVQDGMGLKLLMAAGIQIGVITTSRTALIDHRMKQLGITNYYKGQVEKLTAYESIKLKLQIPDSAFAYIGDDLPDLAILKRVGLGVSVSNGVSEVKECASWVTEKPGGRGAVREVCDFILNAQRKSDIALERYFSNECG